MSTSVGKFDYKQYEHVFGYGYPFFLLAVTEFNRPKNYIIEYYTIHAKYNKEENKLIYQWDSANNYLSQDFNEDDIINIGLRQLKQNLEEKIAESGDELKVNSLPLTERRLNIDSLDLLQTLPDFRKIQKGFLDKTKCTSLRTKINSMDEIEVNLRDK